MQNIRSPRQRIVAHGIVYMKMQPAVNPRLTDGTNGYTLVLTSTHSHGSLIRIGTTLSITALLPLFAPSGPPRTEPAPP